MCKYVNSNLKNKALSHYFFKAYQIITIITKEINYEILEPHEAQELFYITTTFRFLLLTDDAFLSGSCNTGRIFYTSTHLSAIKWSRG